MSWCSFTHEVRGFTAPRGCICCEKMRSAHFLTTYTLESERRRREHAHEKKIRHTLSLPLGNNQNERGGEAKKACIPNIRDTRLLFKRSRSGFFAFFQQTCHFFHDVLNIQISWSMWDFSNFCLFAPLFFRILFIKIGL